MSYVYPLLVMAAALGAVALISGAEEPAAPPPGRNTDLATLERWVHRVADRAAAADDAPGVEVQGGGGAWQFAAFGRPVLVMSDPAANRMRVMTPVVDAEGRPARLDEAALARVLEANYSTALDARYALNGGQLWAAYLHPLGTLTQEDFEGGVIQVLNLSATFGTTYSSTEFQFGGGEDEDGPAPRTPDQVV